LGKHKPQSTHVGEAQVAYLECEQLDGLLQVVVQARQGKLVVGDELHRVVDAVQVIIRTDVGFDAAHLVPIDFFAVILWTLDILALESTSGIEAR